ncbi:FAD-dependent oxidoreductase [Streptomyces sp. NPDC048430]|uniref:NAD(P)/FAD-dependent oxidoreductase n=1 Tax=Streptomyces sp. NPDC048430 TaxID=3155388 RepID=UPI0034439E9E
MTSPPTRIVVVGASAAGLATAENLRRLGFDGRLTLIGEETEQPYDRPPLSKQVLSGAWKAERASLRTPEALAALDLELRLGHRATGLDAHRREVVLAGADRIGYDKLVVATGARARTFPGTEDVEGVHTLRTMNDAVRLREEFLGLPRLLIVGGGFIGAEAAAVAREMGCEVTLVTDTAAPMENALGPVVGTMLADAHRAAGVQLETGTHVAEVLTQKRRVTGARLTDGRTLEADVVLVGIGAIPNTEWLQNSPVRTGNGVECDGTLRAGERIWAAGDVASWPDEATGQRIRIEHRTNAGEQGLAVARNILADPSEAKPFTTVPYVWSDQYDMKIQVHGRPAGVDGLELVEGDPAERRFTALYHREGQVCAAIGVNSMRALRSLRPLVADRAPWPKTPGLAVPGPVMS